MDGCVDVWTDGRSARNKEMNKRLRERCRAGRVVSAIASKDQEAKSGHLRLGQMHVAAGMGKSLPVQTAGATGDD